MPRTIGGGLAYVGNENLGQAQALLGSAAEQEQARNLGNDERERARKAGNTQLGSSVGALGGFAFGATYGSGGGPIGALIGGTLGALGARLF